MILGLDTSTNQISLALSGPENKIEQTELISERRHNEVLLLAIQAFLQQHGLQAKDLTGLAVGLGPGSFTGVRIGIAAALGMAQALNLPIVGLSSFLTIAAKQKSEIVLVLEDAHQGFVYAGVYAKTTEGWVVKRADYLTTIPELIAALPFAVLVTGSGAEQFFSSLNQSRPDWVLAPANARQPDAGVLLQLACGITPCPGVRLIAQGGMPLAEIQPIYLRRTQAEEMLAAKTRGTSE